MKQDYLKYKINHFPPPLYHYLNIRSLTILLNIFPQPIGPIQLTYSFSQCKFLLIQWCLFVFFFFLELVKCIQSTYSFNQCFFFLKLLSNEMAFSTKNTHKYQITILIIDGHKTEIQQPALKWSKVVEDFITYTFAHN